METEKLTLKDQRMIKEALTFYIKEMVINPEHQKPQSEVDQYKVLFLKVARIMKSENETFKTSNI